MAIMKPIKKIQQKEDAITKKGNNKLQKQSGIPQDQREEVRKQLNKGETLLKDGRLMYRAPKTDYYGPVKPPTITAYSLEELRKKEKDLLGSLKRRQNCVKEMTVNDLYYLWKRLKRGIEQSTMRSYVSMYENHVLHTSFGQKLVVDVKKSDVRAFYNSIIDRHIMQARSLEN